MKTKIEKKSKSRVSIVPLMRFAERLLNDILVDRKNHYHNVVANCVDIPQSQQHFDDYSQSHSPSLALGGKIKLN